MAKVNNPIIEQGGVSVKVYRHGTTSVHSHDFVEFTYVLDGEATHVTGDDRTRVRAGDIIIIDLGGKHGYEVDEGQNITLVNCLFYPEFLTRVIVTENFIELAYDLFFSGYSDTDGVKGYLLLTGADTSEIREYILTMTREQEEKQEGYLKVIRSLLTAVVIKTFRLCAELAPARPARSFQRKLVSEIIDYVQAHDSKSLSVSEVSHAMFFSPSYLSRLFKQQTNGSLVKFIQTRKIETAAELLHGSSMSIERIMDEVGYSDKKHFYEVFAERYGMTPGEYRRRENK